FLQKEDGIRDSSGWSSDVCSSDLAPPRLVVVPQVPAVEYVPDPAAPGNLFLYGGQYWAFYVSGWCVSRGYSGPGVVVAPQSVPRPVLLVPVQYYHVPPGHWKQWERAR